MNRHHGSIGCCSDGCAMLHNLNYCPVTAVTPSTSLKVTDFCTNGKPICDLLLVNKVISLSRTVSKL